MNPQSLSLEEIYAPIERELPIVEEKILDILKTPNELSSEVIRYFFKAKGKLLRPALCLIGASFANGVNEASVQNAAALEIFHSATLIHDDIIDSSYLRRNIPTINAVWGPQVAVLVGDYLHDKAIKAIFELRHERAISIFLEMAGLVCDGEILELNQKNNFALTEEQYFTIIERKTAVLLSCCLESSAFLAGLGEKEARHLKQFGIYFGKAFQIVDDCLDFAGKENEFGKTLGADCAAGVLTLPLIRLLKAVAPGKKEEIIRMIQSGFSKPDFQELLRLLEETGALEQAYSKAREFMERARFELSHFSDSSAKRSLSLLLDYVLERNR